MSAIDVKDITYEYLMNLDAENYNSFWCDLLVSNYGEKVWAIPLFPKVSPEAQVICEKFPGIPKGVVNKILKKANDARRIQKKECAEARKSLRKQYY